MKKALITTAKVGGWLLLAMISTIVLVNPDNSSSDRLLWFMALWIFFVHVRLHQLRREVDHLRAR